MEAEAGRPDGRAGLLALRDDEPATGTDVDRRRVLVLGVWPALGVDGPGRWWLAAPSAAPVTTRPGDTCSLTYDTDVEVVPGDFIQTQAGRRYLVNESRLVANRGRRPTGYPFRWKCEVLVLRPDDPDPSGTRHLLFWYPRG